MQTRTTFNTTTDRREGCLLEAQGAMLATDTLAFTASASEAKPLMKRVASGMTPSDRTWKLRDSHDLQRVVFFLETAWGTGHLGEDAKIHAFNNY